MIGIVLNNRYRLDAEVGRGAMGVVYRARDTLLERDVAVKVLSSTTLGAEGRAHLLHEARAAAQLHHPNVVDIHDAGESDPSMSSGQALPFIVMELLDGESLLEHRPDSLTGILSIVRQICAALEHAHAHGIIHRDLKPENVLVTRSAHPSPWEGEHSEVRVKLTDFGLAYSVASRGNSQEAIAGTVLYLPPEQAMGGEIDGRADLYALGVMLYELTTGQLPFTGDDPLAVIAQHLNAPVVPPRARNPEVPAALDALIVQLLSKAPEDRPASAGQVSRVLDRLQWTLGLPPAFLDRLEESTPVDRPIFVGRESELDRLTKYLERIMDDQGQLAFVTGGAGQGKTFLVNELSRRAQDAYPELIVAIGNCNPNTGAGDPYLPFRDVLGMLTGDVEAQWAASALTEAHARRLWDLFPVTTQMLMDHGPDLIDTLVPGRDLAGRAAAHPFDEHEWRSRLEELVAGKSSLTGRTAPHQSRIFAEFTDVLRGLAAYRPLVLILEDLHWVDLPSVSLLFHLGRQIARSRVLIVGTYRPEEVARGRDGEPHPLELELSEFKRTFGDIWIDLDQLDMDRGREFVDALLDSEPNDFGAAFRRGLARITAGHPLFTYELLKDMQERGVIRQNEEGKWVEGPDIAWDYVPTRVEGVIEKRISRLDAELRDALTVASVEGEVFTAEVIARVNQVDEVRLVRRLSEELDGQHRLVIERRTWRSGSQRLSQYGFRHNLIQKYVYNGLGEGERAYMHEEVGNELESLYDDPSEEIALQLAWHFREAGMPEKAIHYLNQAGNRALRLSANQEAVMHFSSALALLKALPESPEGEGQEGKWQETPRLVAWAQLEQGLGRAYYGLGDMTKSIEHLQRALSLLGEPVPADRRRLIVDLVGQVLRQALRRLWPLHLPALPPGTSAKMLEAARAYRQLADIYWFGSASLPLTHAIVTTLNLSERTKPTPELAWAYAATAVVAGLVPIHPLARTYLRRACATAQSLSDPHIQAYVRLLTSVYRSGIGEWKTVRSDLEQAIEMFDLSGDQRHWGESVAVLATTACLQGDTAKSARLWDKLVARASEAGLELLQAWGVGGQAELKLRQGDSDAAVPLLEAALELLRERHPDRSEEVADVGRLVKARLYQGEHDLALDVVESSRQLVSQSLPPTAFSTLVGYAGIAQVCLELWEAEIASKESPGASLGQVRRRSRRARDGDRDLRRAAYQACRALRSYARVFPIGRPCAWLYQGTYNWLAGRHARAHRFWRKSLAAAEALEMPYEQGQICYEIGRHLDADDPARQQYLDRASEAFSRLGATFDLDRARHCAAST